VQRCALVTIHEFDVGAQLQQLLHGFRLAALGGFDEWGLSVLVGTVHVRSLPHKSVHLLYSPSFRCVDELPVNNILGQEEGQAGENSAAACKTHARHMMEPLSARSVFALASLP